MAEFDGSGNFSQVDTVTINGYVVSDFTHPPATGTYTVNSNCTGTYTINFTDGRPPVTSNFVVVDKGNEIDSVALYVNGDGRDPRHPQYRQETLNLALACGATPALPTSPEGLGRSKPDEPILMRADFA